MERAQAKERIEEIKKSLIKRYTEKYYIHDRRLIMEVDEEIPSEILACFPNYTLGDCDYDSVYGDVAILGFIFDKSKRAVYDGVIKFTADWFEHPHPHGREHRGEADFAAIRLIPLLFECPDELSKETKASIDRFFLQRDYSALYKSENHALMYRASRYLASIYYKGRYFEQFKMTAEEIYKKDTAYFKEFYDFRAKRGWGEFDSYGYGGEIMLITSLIHKYTDDAVMKQRMQMVMDIILLDMICDGKDGIYGGAHGRIYEHNALSGKGTMTELYNVFFGSKYYECVTAPSTFALCDYVPSQIVYDIESGRSFPYSNYEQKHLHSMDAWIGEEIDRWSLSLIEGRFINKLTYVDDDYVLGAINHQDKYAPDNPGDAGYAHHQQHEWDLTLAGDVGHKIFSHHPGDPGYHHIHNHWTGDHHCLCSTHYCNFNTAISIYNITKKEQYDYIHAYVPVQVFEKVMLDGNYLFLKYGDTVYVSLYFDNGYEITHNKEFDVPEVISKGRQNCVVLRVAKQKDYSDMNSFVCDVKSKAVVYDRENQRVSFDGIDVWYDGNSENGRGNAYPYGYTYNNPYMKAVWDSGVIECSVGNKKAVYDFINDTMTEE